MKAADWAVKFVANRDEAVKEFAEEMQKLVAERTAQSKKEFFGEALSGAVREQQQKWQAICRRSGVVSESDFSTLMTLHANDVMTEFTRFLNLKKIKQEREAQAKKNSDGRSLSKKVVQEEPCAPAPSLLKGVKAPNKKDKAAGLKMKDNE